MSETPSTPSPVNPQEDSTTEFVGILLNPSSRKDWKPVSQTFSKHRYETKGVLGQGGMGVVELCYDQHIGRLVARKTLSSRPEESTEQYHRFVREIQIQAQLEHPSIVPVFDCETNAEGEVFFTMRRISGTTLLKGIQHLSNLPERREKKRHRNRLLQAFLQICLTIEYAHQRGVIHRDLKPSNLMLGEYGEVYVLDWGIAKVLGEEEPSPAKDLHLASSTPELTHEQSLLGTPKYMSPEQFENSSNVSKASEVFSLGLILFEILTCQHPGRVKEGRHYSCPSTEALRPSMVMSALETPAEYDAICQKACALQPDQRFASVRELHDAVEAVLQGDRDLKLRKKLAEQHLNEAWKVYRNGESPAEIITVLQQAGRALALEPDNENAVKLVTECMLTPLEEVPAGLLDMQSDAEIRDSNRGLTNNAMVSGLVLLLFLLLYPLLQVRQLPLFLAAVIPTFVGMLIMIFNKAGSEMTLETVFRSILVGACFSCPVYFSAFVYGPFALPPLLCAMVCVLTVGVVDIGWRRMIVLSMAISTLLSVFLVFTLHSKTNGLTLSTYKLVFHSQMVTFQKSHILLGGLVFVLLILMMSMAVWSNMNKLVESRRRVLQFEWKLRQLASLPKQNHQ